MKSVSFNLMMLFCLLTCLACHHQDGNSSAESASADYYEGDDMISEEVETAPAAASVGQAFKMVGDGDEGSQPDETATPVRDEAKIIRTAQVKYMVDNLTAATQKTEQLTKQFGGYISTSGSRSDYDRNIFEVTIRVPSGKFKTLMDSLLGLSVYTDHNRMQARDVTAEFVDIEARLKTRYELEKRYLAILQKANNVEDILNVERQLQQIREQIEVAEGRLKYLRNQVGMSTVHVEMYERLEPEAPPTDSFWGKLADAASGGWQLLLGLITGLIYLWPVILIGSVVVFALTRWRQRRKS